MAARSLSAPIRPSSPRQPGLHRDRSTWTPSTTLSTETTRDPRRAAPARAGVVTQAERLDSVSEEPPNRLHHLVFTGESGVSAEVWGIPRHMPSIGPHRNRSDEGADPPDMAPTKNAKTPGLGRRGRGADHTRPHRVVRRLGRRVRPALPGAGRRRDVHPAVRRQAAQQLLGALRPRRRGPRRGPHLHLLGEGDRRRPDQQLARPGRDAQPPRRPLHGLP